MSANLTARLAALLHGSRQGSVMEIQDRAPASWMARMQAALRLPLGRHREESPRIELLHRLSLGGKKVLLLVAIDERRLLIGVGDDGPPSISALDSVYPVSARSAASPVAAQVRSRRRVPRARRTR